MTVTSSPRLGWACAPTDSILSMTACTCSSVAVDFITIIIWRFLLGLGVESRWRCALGRASAGAEAALDPRVLGADTATRPAERLAKSPIPSEGGPTLQGSARRGHGAGVRSALVAGA